MVPAESDVDPFSLRSCWVTRSDSSYSPSPKWWYARAQDCQDAANKGQQVDQHGSVAFALTTSEFYPHFL